MNESRVGRSTLLKCQLTRLRYSRRSVDQEFFSPVSSRPMKARVKMQFSISMLLGMTLVFAVWISSHLTSDILFSVYLETILILAYLAWMSALIQFGTVGHRAFASGAIIAPLAFSLYALRHSATDPRNFGIVEGTYMGPVLLDIYERVWWIVLWLPISIALGCLSLQIQRRLTGCIPIIISTEQCDETKSPSRD